MRLIYLLILTFLFSTVPKPITQAREIIYPKPPEKPVELVLELPRVKLKNLAKAPYMAVKKAPTQHRTYSGSLSDWLYKLRMCESGGNYRINTGNGYYGGYQFSEATWNSWNTGYAYAHLAPPSVQDATIIKNTNAASGGLATQNPGCFKSTGISQFPPG